jgi:hypothetical protein
VCHFFFLFFPFTTVITAAAAATSGSGGGGLAHFWALPSSVAGVSKQWSLYCVRLVQFFLLEHDTLIKIDLLCQQIQNRNE